MTFFDRYKALCDAKGIQPMSQKAADAFGVTRATITAWSKNSTVPKGETVALIADTLGVSTDYLLGRTDDPVDYANPDLVAEMAGPVLDEFNGDVKRAVQFQKAVAQDVARESRTRPGTSTPRIVALYNQLDPIDQVRVEAYVEGILSTDKYRATPPAKKMG